MSGECLCGAFAKPGEIKQIETVSPPAAEQIHALEAKAKRAGVHCVWGTRPPRELRSVATLLTLTDRWTDIETGFGLQALGSGPATRFTRQLINVTGQKPEAKSLITSRALPPRSRCDSPLLQFQFCPVLPASRAAAAPCRNSGPAAVRCPRGVFPPRRSPRPLLEPS